MENMQKEPGNQVDLFSPEGSLLFTAGNGKAIGFEVDGVCVKTTDDPNALLLLNRREYDALVEAEYGSDAVQACTDGSLETYGYDFARMRPEILEWMGVKSIQKDQTNDLFGEELSAVATPAIVNPEPVPCLYFTAEQHALTKGAMTAEQEDLAVQIAMESVRRSSDILFEGGRDFHIARQLAAGLLYKFVNLKADESYFEVTDDLASRFLVPDENSPYQRGETLRNIRKAIKRRELAEIALRAKAEAEAKAAEGRVEIESPEQSGKADYCPFDRMTDVRRRQLQAQGFIWTPEQVAAVQVDPWPPKVVNYLRPGLDEHFVVEFGRGYQNISLMVCSEEHPDAEMVVESWVTEYPPEKAERELGKLLGNRLQYAETHPDALQPFDLDAIVERSRHSIH